MDTGSADHDEDSFNVAVIRGVVRGDVTISELGSGSVVHNFEVKTTGRGERHVVPVAWHDPQRPPRLGPGDEVVVAGAVRRRWFRAGGGSQSRTELVADNVARAGSSRARTALAAAMSMLQSDDLSRR